MDNVSKVGLQLVDSIAELHSGKVLDVANRTFIEGVDMITRSGRSKVVMNIKLILEEDEDYPEYVNVSAVCAVQGNPLKTDTYKLQKTKKGLLQNPKQLEMAFPEDEDGNLLPPGKNVKSMGAVKCAK